MLPQRNVNAIRICNLPIALPSLFSIIPSLPSPFASPHSHFSFLVSLPLRSLPVSLSQLFHLDSPRFLLWQRCDDSSAHPGAGSPLAQVQEEATELCLVLNVPPRTLGFPPTSPARLTRDRDDGTLNQQLSASPQPWRTVEKRRGDHQRLSSVLQVSSSSRPHGP